MIPDEFNLDKRLAADTHHLFKWHDIHLLLHKNATFPWFIMVPETHVFELHELSATTQQNVMTATHVIAQHCKTAYGSEKINFAAIGNVVQQLHIHVIGRHSEDALWPDVVWGADIPVSDYSSNQIEQLKFALFDKLNPGD